MRTSPELALHLSLLPHHTNGRTFEPSTDLTCITPLHNRVYSGTLLELMTHQPRFNTLTTMLPWPSIFMETIVFVTTDYSNSWILSDSRSAIQHLQDWTRLDDFMSIRITNKLKIIAKYRNVHSQRITSHVKVPGNEMTDFLTKRGCFETAITDCALTYREIYSLMKIKNKQVWMAHPDHPGISRKSPVGSLEFDGNRSD
ncbi:RNase H domain-containing protein [Trichonephila clavipes]|nr:RNase H domain-containing protein [Trichonephila clavipes]